MKKMGIYIHIPFCKKKCLYCDFVSFEGQKEIEEKYIQALKKEIQDWIEQNQKVEIETVYIGGGTPSYIESKNISEILDVVGRDAKEITIEVNPGTITRQKLIDYKNAGINRLSIGLQSSKDRLLKQIGRIHIYQEFCETYSLAREVGFKNINVDCIIGLPNQEVEDVKDTLQKLMELKPCKPEHISAYSLIVEQDTPLEKLIGLGKLKLPKEDDERNMYWYAKKFLELNGYIHYEISNFAISGYESKHNLDCWKQKEYRGFGISASSYIDKKRFCNISNLSQYLKNIEENNFKKNIIVEEEQTKEEQMMEYMLLGLRRLNGVSVQQFENKFGENPTVLFKDKLNKLEKENLIMINDNKIKLSNKGLDLANVVWQEFV